MAGVRNKPRVPGGKYQGWFKNRHGKMQHFSGTRSRRETLKVAKQLEEDHKLARLGRLPDSGGKGKHSSRPLKEAEDEYVDWGESQGGRGGRPWGRVHARNRRMYLKWWREQLKLQTLGDLDGVLPKAEKALRQLQAAGRTGKTLSNIAETLRAFSLWCVKRGYLGANPVESMQRFDTTPQKERRAMTLEEIHKLLDTAPLYRRLLYEVAFMSGLRANELRALTQDDLDTSRCGLKLHAEWTKGRKPGFQPLPRALVGRLQMFARAGTAEDLYTRHGTGRKLGSQRPQNPLLFVPTNTSRMIYADLDTAGIPRKTKDGVADFHSCRVAYVTLVVEAGATVKEAQELARHSTPDLTMNVYSKSREERLAALAEKVGEMAFRGQEIVPAMYAMAAGAEQDSPNLLPVKQLGRDGVGSEGGTRTHYLSLMRRPL